MLFYSMLMNKELHYINMVMSPGIEELYIKHIELIKIKAETILAVLVTMTNAIKNYIIKMDDEIEDGLLREISNYINHNYGEMNIVDILNGLKHKIAEKEDNLTKLAAVSAEIIKNVMDAGLEGDVFVNGLEFFAEHPEFGKSEIARNILHFFSDTNEVKNLMKRELPFNGTLTHSGGENDPEILKQCSIITCGYGVKGRIIGRIGVVGPTRMDYDNVINTMECLSRIISEKLKNDSRGE